MEKKGSAQTLVICPDCGKLLRVKDNGGLEVFKDSKNAEWHLVDDKKA